MSSLVELNVFPLMQDLEFFFSNKHNACWMCLLCSLCVFVGVVFFSGLFLFSCVCIGWVGLGLFFIGVFFRVFVLGWVGVGVGLVDGGARQLQRSARAICGFHKSPEQGLNLSES